MNNYSRKYTGSHIHAFPPVLIVTVLLFIPQEVKFIKKLYSGRLRRKFKRRGISKRFYKNGKLKSETEYDNVGNILQESDFDKNGAVISVKD
ncbi:hypothetical protein [Treponema pedis]|uniref:Uncharacterized protein n=1 Tax=Treponema pedis TaxID=409322 RepID=A0A7S6WPT2_9SPIR|nr:hypothetical protein [Treponema pedis]QOW61076.1 hypothetical protein IFE08_01275 [Treponema pedis]